MERACASTEKDSRNCVQAVLTTRNLDALVNLVTQLAMNQKSAFAPVARVYGLCSSADHYTDLCHSLQQSRVNEQPKACAANIYNRPPQQQNQQQQTNYDLSSNIYNPGCRNHPNLRWASPPQQKQPVPPFQNAASPNKPYVPPPMQQQQQQQQRQLEPEAPPQSSLEELVRQMTIQNMQFQQETRASIQSLTN